MDSDSLKMCMSLLMLFTSCPNSNLATHSSPFPVTHDLILLEVPASNLNLLSSIQKNKQPKH